MIDPQQLPPSKFSPRQLGPSQLNRERLITALERNAHAKLVLLQAPAGYGKTTCMVQWYEHLAATGQGLGWVYLDDDDNDAGRLVSALSVALSPEAHGGIDLFDSINRCLQAHANFTLFLDEEEHVTAADAQHLLEVLLNYSPVNLHLVVGSRAQPQRLATRLRMRSDFLELTAQDLAFSVDEIAQFVRIRCGITLDADSQQFLARRTEGWAAVLQLAAFDIAQGESPSVTLSQLTAPHSNLFQYLSDDVLVHLQPQQYEFLLQTAFVQELSGPLCDAITGRSDSQMLLSELLQANLLLTPLDPGRRKYRYHGLFADLLRQQLRALHPTQLPILARRASDWCLRSQEPEAAVEYALLADDPEHLIACISNAFERLITRAQFSTAKRWLRAISPETLRQRPELLVWTAWVEVYTNDFAAAESAITDLELLASRRALPNKDALGSSILKAMLLILRTRYIEALATTELAWRDTPPTERRFMAALSNLRGLLRLMGGHFVAAAQDTDRVLAIAAQPPPICLSFVHASHISGMTELALGNLSGAWRQFDLSSDLLTTEESRSEAHGNPSHLLALLSGPKALVLYLLNKLDDAEDCLERYAPFLNTMFSPSSRTLWHLLRARVCALHGEQDGCLAALQEGSVYAARHGIAWMATAMQWERIDHDLARADIDRARASATALLEDVSLATAPEWIAPWEEIFGPTISAMRLLIHGSDSRQALELLQVHIAQCERQLRRLRLSKLRVLEALAHERLGERTPAVDALRKAVDVGQASGAIRIFVDEGTACLGLLRQLAQDGKLPPTTAVYVRELQAAFADSEETVDRPDESVSAAATPIPLSVRETQILERLAEGHSNLAVGQQLFLSPNTVKWHLSQIYAKLGVRNRTQAVHVARQQRLTQVS